MAAWRYHRRGGQSALGSRRCANVGLPGSQRPSTTSVRWRLAEQPDPAMRASAARHILPETSHLAVVPVALLERLADDPDVCRHRRRGLHRLGLTGAPGLPEGTGQFAGVVFAVLALAGGLPLAVLSTVSPPSTGRRCGQCRYPRSALRQRSARFARGLLSCRRAIPAHRGVVCAPRLAQVVLPSPSVNVPRR